MAIFSILCIPLFHSHTFCCCFALTVFADIRFGFIFLKRRLSWALRICMFECDKTDINFLAALALRENNSQQWVFNHINTIHTYLYKYIACVLVHSVLFLHYHFSSIRFGRADVMCAVCFVLGLAGVRYTRMYQYVYYLYNVSNENTSCGVIFSDMFKKIEEKTI